MFVYCASDGQVLKFGSSFHPHRRLNELRRTSGRDLELLCIWPLGRIPRSSAYIAEGHVLDALGRRRSWDGSNEWFRLPLPNALATANAAIHEVLTWWRLRTFRRTA